MSNHSKTVSKAAKEKVSKALNQAKDTLKLLESYKALLKLPRPEKVINRKALMANLKRLGIATHDEVEELRKRIEKLESSLQNHSSHLDSGHTSSSTSETTTSAQ